MHQTKTTIITLLLDKFTPYSPALLAQLKTVLKENKIISYYGIHNTINNEISISCQRTIKSRKTKTLSIVSERFTYLNSKKNPSDFKKEFLKKFNSNSNLFFMSNKSAIKKELSAYLKLKRHRDLAGGYLNLNLKEDKKKEFCVQSFLKDKHRILLRGGFLGIRNLTHLESIRGIFKKRLTQEKKEKIITSMLEFEGDNPQNKNLILSIDFLIASRSIEDFRLERLKFKFDTCVLNKDFSELKPKSRLCVRRKTFHTKLLVSIFILEFNESKHTFGYHLVSTISSLFKQKENETWYYRTRISSKLSYQIIKIINSNLNVISLSSNLNMKFKRGVEKLFSELLLNDASLKDLDLFKDYLKDFEVDKLLFTKKEEEFFFSNFLMSILEIVNVFSETKTFFKKGISKNYTLSHLNPDLNLNDNNMCVYFKENLPLFSKPLDWILKKDLNSFNPIKEVVNRRGETLLNIKQSLEDKCILSKKDLETINYLQSTQFKINKNYFNFVNKNLIFCLFAYTCESEADFSIFEGVDFISNSPINLFEVRNDVRKLQSIKIIIKSSEDLKKEGLLTEERIESLRMKSVKFFNTFFTARAIKSQKFPFFFSLFVDYRFRIYCRQESISFQGDSFARTFLTLIPQNSLSNKNILDEKSIKALLKRKALTYDKEGVEKRSKLFVHLLNQLKIKFSEALVSLDASASSFSILSALSGYEYGLIFSNVLKRSSEEDTFRNFYDQILPGLFSQKESKLLFLKIKTSKSVAFFRTFKSDSIPFFSKKIESFIEDVVALYLNLFKNKNFRKEIQIAFIFSENSVSRARRFLTQEEEINKRQKQFYEEIKNFNSTSKEEKIHLDQLKFSIALIISHHFVRAFKICHTDIYELVAFIKGSIASSKNIRLLNNGCGVFYKLFDNEESTYSFKTHFKTKVKNQRYTNINKDSTFSNRYIQFSDSGHLDLVKVKSSLVVNFIHRIDSHILLSLTYELKKLNIPCFVIHDSITVHAKFSLIVKKLYFNSFIEILNSKMLDTFVSSNVEMTSSSEIKQKLDQFQEKRVKIINKIKNGELISSLYVLK